MLVRGLRKAACFAGTEHQDQEAPADPDRLLLTVHLMLFEENSTYDIPIAALDAPDLPPDAQNNVVVRMRMDMLAELSTAAEAARFRHKRFALSAAHRPVMREDPRYAARDALLEDAASNAVRFACKGSAKKLAREIEQAGR